jgi:hypothetical protein
MQFYLRGDPHFISLIDNKIASSCEAVTST